MLGVPVGFETGEVFELEHRIGMLETLPGDEIFVLGADREENAAIA